ncbi:hypothetical protein ACTFIZ_010685 [Dictyostelium cf. discoideum]
MRLVILIIFIYLFIIPIFCQTQPNPKSFLNTDTTITFEWDLNDNNYYTKWIIIRPNDAKLEMPFNCVKGATSLKCIYTNSDSTVNQLYGKNVTACINSLGGNCDSPLSPLHYPTPILKSPIPEISVDGGEVIVTGTFLKFVESPNYYEIVGSESKITFIDDLTKQEFNPTNVTLRFPSGCGSNKFILLPNEQKIPFSYKKPNITSSSLISDNIVELIGINFCNDQSVAFDGKLMASSDVKILSTTKLQFNITQEFSSTGIPIKVGDSEVKLVFPPIVNSYDPFCGLDGVVVIHGKRLKSNNPNSEITVKVENTNCNVLSSASNSTYLQCHIESGYDKNLIVRIDDIASTPIMFYYEQPIIYKTTIVENIVSIDGFCLSKIKDIQVDGTTNNNKTTPLSTSNSIVTFNLDPQYFGETFITISNEKYTASTNVTTKLFAKVSADLNAGDSAILLDVYYNDPQGTLKCNDKSKSTGNGIKDYTFEINPICGTINLTLTDGTNEFVFQVTSKPAKITDCKLLSNGQTQCMGDRFIPDQFNSSVGTVSFAGKNVETTFLNSTSFTFTTLDDMYAGDLYLDSCSLSQKVEYKLEPVILSYDANGFSKTGGVASFIGKYFAFNSNHVKIQNCGNNQTIQCTVTSHTIIDCPISIDGPRDRTCYITRDDNSSIIIGNQKDGSFIISFSEPSPIASTSLGLEGGSLIIFGKNFYNTTDYPLLVSVGNITCNSPILVDESNIHCILSPNSNPNYLTVFDNLQDVNVTLAGRSGIGKIFSYSRNLTATTIDNSFNSMYIITAIVILIGLIVAYLQFTYYYKKNRKEFISNYKLIKKQCKKQQQQQYGRPHLQMTETRSQSYANY